MDFPRITFLRRTTGGADHPFDPPAEPLGHRDPAVHRALASVDRRRRVEFRAFVAISAGTGAAGLAWALAGDWPAALWLVPLGPVLAWLLASPIGRLICRLTPVERRVPVTSHETGTSHLDRGQPGGHHP